MTERVRVVTLCCGKNLVDSEIMSGLIHECGFRLVEVQEMNVLVELYDDGSDVYIGRTMDDAPEIDGEAFISSCRAKIGNIQKVRVTHAYEFDLSGEGIA
ncbi:hypothetical protein [Paenibacillus paeoniae]|uniref:hypothetical protein n=1 Tax=Paenibacillus paeoniae TaxID=2292705 RepID=UPI001402CC30